MREIDHQLIDNEKKRLRSLLKEQKKLFTSEERDVQSKNIIQQIKHHPAFVSAKTVMAYWALKDEVDLSELILKWTSSKKFLLPCVKGDELEIRVFEGLNSLATGSSFGIQEPNGEIFTNYSEIDLILVPGVAFDIENNRLGRGKAYYDKFLPQTKAIKIGVCFDFQLFDTVPSSNLDIKMDDVICYNLK